MSTQYTNQQPPTHFPGSPAVTVPITMLCKHSDPLQSLSCLLRWYPIPSESTHIPCLTCLAHSEDLVSPTRKLACPLMLSMSMQIPQSICYHLFLLASMCTLTLQFLLNSCSYLLHSPFWTIRSLPFPSKEAQNPFFPSTQAYKSFTVSSMNSDTLCLSPYLFKSLSFPIITVQISYLSLPACSPLLHFFPPCMLTPPLFPLSTVQFSSTALWLQSHIPCAPPGTH